MALVTPPRRHPPPQVKGRLLVFFNCEPGSLLPDPRVLHSGSPVRRGTKRDGGQGRGGQRLGHLFRSAHAAHAALRVAGAPRNQRDGGQGRSGQRLGHLFRSSASASALPLLGEKGAGQVEVILHAANTDYPQARCHPTLMASIATPVGQKVLAGSKW